jgi:hypothetical protein
MQDLTPLGLKEAVDLKVRVAVVEESKLHTSAEERVGFVKHEQWNYANVGRCVLFDEYSVDLGIQ